MIKGTYHKVTVKPNIDTACATTYTIADLLFDWTAFEIPRGACLLHSIQAIMAGTDGADGNVLDFDLLFATSYNAGDGNGKVAPPSLGTVNGAIGARNAILAKNHLTGYKFMDGDKMSDAGGDLVSYNVWSNTAGNTIYHETNLVLEGDPTFPGDDTYSKTTSGYQTLWVAGIAQGAFNFGTAMEIDAGSGYAAGDTATLNCDGTAGDILFAPGDELIAADGALIGKVKTISDDGSHTTVVLQDNVTATLADDDEVCYRQPITLHLGFEY
tara:strand:+ start:45 stop:854 length:810 start_codon:yes stop_codon:yes gene_type:complete